MLEHTDYFLAQSSVLGAVLIDQRAAADVVAALQPEDFSGELDRSIFQAIRELYLFQEEIDPVKVLRKLGERGPECRAHLLELMDVTPTAANVREYIAIVREQSRLRAVRSAGVQLATEGTSLEEARELVARLNGLMVERSGVECLSMEQGLVQFYQELEKKTVYLPWGLDFLDEDLTAESGDYIVLGGYPSDGKTALALSLAYRQARDMRVGFFSLETKPSKLFHRIYSAAAQVSSSRIKRRSLTEDDHFLLERKAEELRTRKLALIQASSMSVEDIAAYTRAQRYQVIYIDYLTLIQAPGRTEYDQATYISKALHRLAQDTGITVVALSQLARPSSGAVRVPTLSSLRSSGQIEQDADIVLFVYREEPGVLRSRRILDVAKNKEGRTGRIPLLFDGETQTFRADAARPILQNALPKKPAYEQMQFQELEDPDPDMPF